MAVIFAIILGIAVAALVMLFPAWILMLILGALSSMLALPELAVGFWVVFLVLWAIGIIGSVFRGSSNSSS